MRRIAFIILAVLMTMGLNKLVAGEIGIASIYSVNSNGGRHTASGSRLSDHDLTAAHKTLPLGSKVKVSCLKTGKSVIVKITDRGPYIKGRIIDLTPAAAKHIGLTWHQGLKKVSVTRVDTKTQIAEKKAEVKPEAILAKPLINPNEPEKQSKIFNWTVIAALFDLAVDAWILLWLFKLNRRK